MNAITRVINRLIASRAIDDKSRQLTARLLARREPTS
ncbi:hypothetical protein RHRU231_840008 [Rhodococcus ruber]|uniref:Uncharacterized protein n=1 Tax=Rhodococcus ruber TaxID=1830 RepID=A0A098BS08_9NOCA|nr:hypothetical protein RHRU231_840008 [Rhodococcus ruber]